MLWWSLLLLLDFLLVIIEYFEDLGLELGLLDLQVIVILEHKHVAVARDE